MPNFNEVLSSRFQRLLRAWLPLDEQEGAPTLAPELQVGFDLMNPRDDLRVLMDQSLASRYFDVTGDATHPAIAQISNPTGSGLLVTLHEISLRSGVAGADVYLRDDSGAALVSGSVTLGLYRDRRRYPKVSPVSVRTAVDQPAAGNILQLVHGATSPSVFWNPRIILFPGTWYSLTSANNAVRISGHFAWEERPFQPGEAFGAV